MRLILAYQLHRPHLGRTRKSAGGKRVDERLHGVGVVVERAADARHEVYHVGVVLQVLVELHLHSVAVAAKVVARQVNEHHVLGVFLGVVAQVFSPLAVGLGVAGALRRAGYGVDVSLAPLYAAVGLGRRAEYAEASEVEVEQIGRGVHRAQSAVELEVVALVALHEAAREHYLEHVAPEAVAYAAPDVGLVLLVGERRCGLANGVEGVGVGVVLVHQLGQSVDAAGVAQGDDGHAVGEMVEHHDVPIHYI